MTKSIVIYHASCVDGFTAAWIAHRALGDSAEYVPASYGDDPPDVTDKDVYILDFSYKRSVMLKLVHNSNKLVCIDHHKSAESEIKDLRSHRDELPVIVFDASKSGAMLTWEYFFPAVFAPRNAVPNLISYVQDRDLWTWHLPHSREISAVIASHPMEFATWDFLHDRLAGPFGVRDMAREGEAILRYQSKLIDSAVSHAGEITIAGHRVPAVNATCLMSEIGERLAEGRPFGATYFVACDGRAIWSLRSNDQGIDVSEIARIYGGGGHKHAAGFRMGMSTMDIFGRHAAFGDSVS